VKQFPELFFTTLPIEILVGGIKLWIIIEFDVQEVNTNDVFALYVGVGIGVGVGVGLGVGVGVGLGVGVGDIHELQSPLYVNEINVNKSDGLPKTSPTYVTHLNSPFIAPKNVVPVVTAEDWKISGSATKYVSPLSQSTNCFIETQLKYPLSITKVTLCPVIGYG
jgi:hypothetical protein